MPAKSEKQQRFMQAVAHSPSFAKKVGVSQSVGREFTGKGKAMKKMASGGSYRKVADGIAKKGKTKGKEVKMAGGGKMKGCS